MATLDELMKNLPPVSGAYQQDVYAPMREYSDWLSSQPQTDLAPFFQAMQNEPQAPVPQMSVPGAVSPLNQFLSLMGGNLAAAQSGNQGYAEHPLQAIQGRQQMREEAQRGNEAMKIQAAQQEYERSRQLKLKMHEMQMQQAIQRGDLAAAAKENEARFKMLDLQRQEDARLAQAQGDRELMMKTASQVEVEQAKGTERVKVENVKNERAAARQKELSGLPKEALAELNQRLQGIRSVYSAQAAMGFPIDQDVMQKEMEKVADEVIAKHKGGGAAKTETTEDKVRARARELAASRKGAK